ncbi:MAG: XRE family transcriptional regulator [Candidatus Melainabacteria bacterium]|nr:XRE family transcriptional regulator [Candidatus Melainabacteria bacterium]
MPRLTKSPKESPDTRRRASHLRSKQSRAQADFVAPVRELLMLRVSREIDRRQWTQAQAAKFLAVTQPRISDLMRGVTEKFTIDTLVHWLALLGMELKIDAISGGTPQSLYAWLDASEEAIPYYTKKIASQPGQTENYWKRAYAYHQRGQYDLAIGDYTRAMEIDVKLQYLRVNRAQSYICLGQFNSAFIDCDQLIAQSPEASALSWAYITRAFAHQSLGKQQEALQEFAKAIDAAPDLASAYFHRGAFFDLMNNSQAAIKDFSRVLEIEPNNSQAQQHLDTIRKRAENKNDDE